MSSGKVGNSTTKKLREKAELIAQNNIVTAVFDADKLSKAEINALFHDLQVHQIELQLQNDELQQSQLQLDASRNKYFELYNMAPVGYFTTNEKGIIKEANLTFCTFVDYPKRDIVNKPLSHFILSDDQDILYKHTIKLKATDELQECELRMIAYESTRFWVCMSTKRIYDNDINEYVYHNAVTDISAIKSQEQLLAQQNRLLQALINSPDDSIFSLDRKYRYTAFNKHYFTEMQNLWHADIKIGDRVFDYMTKEEAAKAKIAMNKVFSGERFVHVVLTPQNAFLEIEWNPVYSDKSEVVGITAFQRNITTKKEAEQILLNNNKYLAVKVQERTRELLLSKSELEAFSTSVAHDLSSQILTINGFAKILQEDYRHALDDNALDLLKVIQVNARKMSDFINALLHLSRITDSGLGYSPIDMKKHIAHIWEELEIETKDTVTMDIAELPEAMCDSRLIQIVWTSLLSNAVKYTRNQKLRKVTITGSKKGQFVEYCITDTGVGFDMKDYAKLFQVFHRLHDINQYEGSGVGLAIVQRIVKMHGGTIWAIGEVGKGAEFHFTLPVAE